MSVFGADLGGTRAAAQLVTYLRWLNACWWKSEDDMQKSRRVHTFLTRLQDPTPSQPSSIFATLSCLRVTAERRRSHTGGSSWTSDRLTGKSTATLLRTFCYDTSCTSVESELSPVQLLSTRVFVSIVLLRFSFPFLLSENRQKCRTYLSS